MTSKRGRDLKSLHKKLFSEFSPQTFLSHTEANLHSHDALLSIWCHRNGSATLIWTFADVMLGNRFHTRFNTGRSSWTTHTHKTPKKHTEREKPLHSCVHLSPISEEADSALAGVYDLLLLHGIVGGDREIDRLSKRGR